MKLIKKADFLTTVLGVDYGESLIFTHNEINVLIKAKRICEKADEFINRGQDVYTSLGIAESSLIQVIDDIDNNRVYNG